MEVALDFGRNDIPFEPREVCPTGRQETDAEDDGDLGRHDGRINRKVEDNIFPSETHVRTPVQMTNGYVLQTLH